MAYVELHAKSAFSFLESSALPETLADRAARLGYPALAVVDRDGVYGAPRFYQAAKALGLRAMVGAEIALEGGGRLPLLVENRTGYQNLCALITATKLRAAKGRAAATLDDLAAHAAGLVCLTGGDEGPFAARPPSAWTALFDRLIGIFGKANVFVELQRHQTREQEARNQALIDAAARASLPLVATNGVTHSWPEDRPLLDVLTSIRHGVPLDRAGRLLAANDERSLKSPAEMARLFVDYPQAVANTAALADRLQFTLRDLGYRFPDYPVPTGETMDSYLHGLTWSGARDRYRPLHEKARGQIERELALITKLGLAGYFLIVWDLVRFCRDHGILVQGRGSAANSAVCYSLGITAVDPVGMDLLFERFLSEERGEWPDIDLDLPSGEQRERVIQYVYRRYGERGAAMTANVITYRGRSAARDVGKALGFPPDALDRLSRLVSQWGDFQAPIEIDRRLSQAGLDPTHPRVRHFVTLWRRIQDLPRHIGQHSGGMVLCQGRLDTIVPLEPATMPGRVVVQWDKEDCAELGILKVDLLGLGMMAVLEESLALIRQQGGDVDLAHLPPDDPKVYAALQKADTIGVFQVESRAQMASLPRMKPRRFYDLVVQVAIIRPGPIVGQMAHPYFNRRAGREPVTYPHPSLEPILKRTLGVPLFQEQLLRIAMVAAGFSGGQAEELRRAMGFKRSEVRMRELEAKLRSGMDRNGIVGKAQDEIVRAITAFALYGFPESHAASFALLAYASAYLRTHHAPAFYAALINNQPLGFYHVSTVVKDAQRRGVRILPVNVQRSAWRCTVEEGGVRLGLVCVRGLRAEIGTKIEAERAQRPFATIDDFARRTHASQEELRVLAEIGAFNGLAPERRAALWQAERAARPAGPLLDRISSHAQASPLRSMTAQERLLADYRGTGLTIGPHPMTFCRQVLAAQGIVAARDLAAVSDGSWVRTAGMVIVRQRPGTAKGFFFVSLEDETGIANLIFTPQMFARDRVVLVTEPFLWVEGVLQNQDGVVAIKARRVRPLTVGHEVVPSHDFH
ncbi:MAG: error-prone DNA polymerase [Armatimonadota bacterium]|nr:error-prone DNA polymerase [Armatimonadota bacterium]